MQSGITIQAIEAEFPLMNNERVIVPTEFIFYTAGNLSSLGLLASDFYSALSQDSNCKNPGKVFGELIGLARLRNLPDNNKLEDIEERINNLIGINGPVREKFDAKIYGITADFLSYGYPDSLVDQMPVGDEGVLIVHQYNGTGALESQAQRAIESGSNVAFEELNGIISRIPKGVNNFYLSDLEVLQAHRNKKVAKSLINYAMENLSRDAAVFHGILLDSNPYKENVMHIFNEHGFSFFHINPKESWQGMVIAYKL